MEDTIVLIVLQSSSLFR